MRKHIATFAGLVLALAFVFLFFYGRSESKPLDVVATRVGLKVDDLVAMAPRISSQTGATMGTSRRVVYLMACSGVATGATLEAHAKLAADVAEKQRLSPREATKTVLRTMQISDEAASLRDC